MTSGSREPPPPVVACVDGSAFSSGVCACAAWLGGRLQASVEVLHLDDRHPGPNLPLPAAARLERYLRTTGEQLICHAADQVVEAGGELADVVVGHGDFTEVASRISQSVAALVMGQQGQGTPCYSALLGGNARRLAWRSQAPICLAPATFRPVRRALVLFNAGFPDEALSGFLASHPCLDGLECELRGFGSPRSWTTRDARGGKAQAAFPDRAMRDALETGSYDLLVLPRSALLTDSHCRDVEGLITQFGLPVMVPGPAARPGMGA